MNGSFKVMTKKAKLGTRLPPSKQTHRNKTDDERDVKVFKSLAHWRLGQKSAEQSHSISFYIISRQKCAFVGFTSEEMYRELGYK